TDQVLYFRLAEAVQVVIQAGGDNRQNLSGNLQTAICQFDDDYATIVGRALARNEAFGFESVQRARHGTGIDMAVAREFGGRVDAQVMNDDQRPPLHGGKAKWRNALVYHAVQRALHQLYQ